MKEKKLVPKLRFPGFTEPWEQRKLGDLFKERNERSEQGDLISVTISQGVIKAADLDRDINSSVDKHNYKRVKPGDVVYNTMRMWQGACGHSPYEGILSPAYTVLIPAGDTLGKLFDYYFKHTGLLQVFKKYSQGMTSDTWNLKFDILKQLSLPLPSVEEQIEIAQLFSKYDTLITLHQRKLEHLKLKKKSLLQKLFPKEGEVYPELRFPGFTDPWEQRKLSSLTEYIGTGKSRFVIKEFGEYAILGSTNVIGYDDAYDYDGNFILTARVGANAGQLYQYSGKVKITDNTVFLMSDRSQFIYYALTHFDLRRLSFGTGQPLVKSSELQKLKLCVPVSKSEQEKIGEIFNNIDNIITLHQRKLEHLQLLKKALLQQLFV